MKALACGAALAGLCLAVPVLAGDARDSRRPRYVTGEIREIHGARYRVMPAAERIGSEALCHVVREGAGTGETIAPAQRRVRGEEMIALMLRSVGAGTRVPYTPERSSSFRGGSEEVYAQRHGAYKVLSGGARLLFDERGEISEAFLTFAIEDFPAFRPKPEVELTRAARRAVPLPTNGKPFRSEFLIDANGDEPARLVYFVTFPVQRHGHASGWNVNVDAVTGKVLYSSSTDLDVTRGAGASAP